MRLTTFLENKYKNWYFKIIENRKLNPITNIYTEKHHILPRSLGGSDETLNLINLTAREHFICHALLCKMVKENTLEWYKVHNAFIMMKCNSTHQDRYFNSKLYSYYRNNFSKTMSETSKGENNSQFGTIWVSNLDLEISKKVKAEELNQFLAQGFLPKRIIDFKKYKQKIKLKEETVNERYFKNYNEVKNIYDHFKSTNLSLRKYCEIHYEKSHVSLFKRFKTYGLKI